MDDFRMKLQKETEELSKKVANGNLLTPEELKVLFLNTFLSEEDNG